MKGVKELNFLDFLVFFLSERSQGVKFSWLSCILWILSKWKESRSEIFMTFMYSFLVKGVKEWSLLDSVKSSSWLSMVFYLRSDPSEALLVGGLLGIKTRGSNPPPTTQTKSFLVLYTAVKPQDSLTFKPFLLCLYCLRWWRGGLLIS